MARVDALLAAAREAGLEVRVVADELVIRGPGRRTHSPDASWPKNRSSLPCWSVEDAEVAWRMAAMRPQVPHRGAIPVLVARAVGHRRAVALVGSCCKTG